MGDHGFMSCCYLLWLLFSFLLLSGLVSLWPPPWLPTIVTTFLVIFFPVLGLSYFRKEPQIKKILSRIERSTY